MSKLITLIIFALSLANAYAADSPKEVMQKSFEAIQKRDAKTLQQYFIVDEKRTRERGQALAELIVFVHSGRADELGKQYKEEKESIGSRPLSKYMIRMIDILGIPPFDLSAQKGEFIREENTYQVKYKAFGQKERNHVFDLKATDDGIRFWPRSIKPSDDWITVNTILKEYWAIFENNPQEKHRDKMDELILKYVEPTDLEYSEGLVSGMMDGTTWNFKKGMAKWWGGKIQISLSDSLSSEETCPAKLISRSIVISASEPGEYDLALTEVNMVFKGKKYLNLWDGAKIKFEIDESSKTVRGQIAAKYNSKNHVNGAFEVPWCDE